MGSLNLSKHSTYNIYQTMAVPTQGSWLEKHRAKKYTAKAQLYFVNFKHKVANFTANAFITHIVSGAAALSSGGKSTLGLRLSSLTACAKVASKVRTRNNIASFVSGTTNELSFLGPWKYYDVQKLNDINTIIIIIITSNFAIIISLF